MNDADRRLEVVVLMARGLPSWVHTTTGIKHKLVMNLFSAADPDGTAFASKISPWAVNGHELSFGDQGALLRFGGSSQTSLGLCAHFVLGGRCAPAVASDVRFAESARLCVKLMVSGKAGNSWLGKAAGKLQSAVSQVSSKELSGAVSAELDDAFAQSLGEVHLPLTNVLSGRVDCAADRALGGWIPLLPESGAPTSQERMDGMGMTPGLWMQVYVVPDHNAVLPSLRSQLETQAGIKKEAKVQGSSIGEDSSVPESQPAETSSTRPGLQSALPTVVWGPASAQKPAQPQDLLDFDDVNEPAPDRKGGSNSQNAAQGDLLDFMGDACPMAPAASEPQAIGTGATSGSNAFSFVTDPAIASNDHSTSSAFNFIGTSATSTATPIEAAPVQTAPGGNNSSSAFSFIGSSASPGVPAKCISSSGYGSSSSGSAFNFISQPNPESKASEAQLDLGALYEGTLLWKAPVVASKATYDPKYQALQKLEPTKKSNADFSDLDILGKQSLNGK